MKIQTNLWIFQELKTAYVYYKSNVGTKICLLHAFIRIIFELKMVLPHPKRWTYKKVTSIAPKLQAASHVSQTCLIV